jgi:hypothetical protein
VGGVSKGDFLALIAASAVRNGALDRPLDIVEEIAGNVRGPEYH